MSRALAPILLLAAVAAVAGPARHATLPAASPDGHTIAFASQRDSTSELYLLEMANGLERRLTYSPADEGPPNWDANGTRVLYTLAAGDSLDLVATSPSGASLGRIARRRAKSIRLAPDGRALAWTDGSWTRNRIWVQDSTRARARALTDSTSAWYNLAWSHDGRMLAATRSDSSGALQIWVLPADGKRARPLVVVAPEAGRPQWPAWSHDDRTIAFQLNASRDDAYVCTVDLASGQLTQLREHPTPILDEAPCWLGDDSLVFQSNESGAFELWAMHADGSGARRLTRQ